MRDLPVPYEVAVGVWFVFEMSLLVRDLVRRRRVDRRDRGTRALLAGTFYVSVLLSWTAPRRFDVGAPRAFAIAGIVVIAAGLVLRAWAVAVLGRSFRTFIQVDSEQ